MHSSAFVAPSLWLPQVPRATAPPASLFIPRGILTQHPMPLHLLHLLTPSLVASGVPIGLQATTWRTARPLLSRTSLQQTSVPLPLLHSPAPNASGTFPDVPAPPCLGHIPQLCTLPDLQLPQASSAAFKESVQNGLL